MGRGFLESFSLSGRVALLTGSTGLYGLQFASALAEAGATVALTSRTADRALRQAVRLRDDGLLATGHVLNQGLPESIEHAVDEVIATHGQIDILINNAVHREGGDLFATTAANWDATSAVNSRGLFLVTAKVGRHMADRGSGSIVNIASIYGVVSPDFTVYEGLGMSSPAFYAFDKGGMINFTRYVAAALGPSGVRCNCLCPGGFDPQESEHNPEFVARYAERTPLRRMAAGHDVSGAVVFLSSPAAAYITGAVLPVDGGWTAK